MHLDPYVTNYPDVARTAVESLRRCGTQEVYDNEAWKVRELVSAVCHAGLISHNEKWDLLMSLDTSQSLRLHKLLEEEKGNNEEAA